MHKTTYLRAVSYDEETPTPPIGERLVKIGVITRDQLHIALHEQRQNGLMLGNALVRLGFLDENCLATALAEKTGFEQINLYDEIIDNELLMMLPKGVAERCHAIPIRIYDDNLEVAMADPYDIMAIDEIRRYFPRHLNLIPRVAGKTDIAAIISQYHGATHSLDGIISELETGKLETLEAADHPMIRLVNNLLFDAVNRGASDIHLEPESSFVRVRYRIDGQLLQIRSLHREHWTALSHRLKIIAGMNIANTRVIQDGRFKLLIGGREIDFRAAIMPTVWGENIAVRILDHKRSLLPLDKLGFNERNLSVLQKILQRPQGITLVTGPTGSGKTTTLYSILREISSIEVNIATLEDPVEYQLDLIRQTTVQEEQGLGFAAGIRGVLRMDPDIILIGEVRDMETAQMALRAAMTGHQIYSTLHCNDALSAIPRLVDLGLHPRVLAGSINGVISQRLVRKLCPHCKHTHIANAEECDVLRCNTSTLPVIYEASGCKHCNQTGALGRTVISEIISFSPEMDDMIMSESGRSELLKQCRVEGFKSIQEDGIALVLKGEVSLSDIRRSVDLTRGD